MTLDRGGLEIMTNDEAPTLGVDSVTLLPAGSQPTVVNVGTPKDARFAFGIPAGAQGGQGNQGNSGSNGNNGLSPTITIGSVTTLAPGASATASVDATGYPALVLNLGIPQGAAGSGTTFAWGGATGTLSDQVDLQTALDAKAPKASPVFTGNPQAPTPTAGDNDTSIATTGFVATAVSNGVNGLAPLADPTFTGNPKAPTPSVGDNDSSIATTGFVHNELSGYAALDGALLINNPKADGNFIGYRNLPTSRTISTTGAALADGDKGKKIVWTGGTGTLNLNPNATTAIDADAIGSIVNDGTGALTLARGAGVSAKLMGTGTDANRVIAPGGWATWAKIGTDKFYVGGPGVT